MLLKFSKFLNSITMYRSVLYSLLFLYLATLICSFFNLVSFSSFSILVSLLVLVLVSFTANFLFSKLYQVKYNPESHLITSLILFFLFSPATSKTEFLTLITATLIATASKYILKFNNHHFFNPAAFGALFTPLLGLDGAIWWVATPNLFLPSSLVFLYLVSKLRRQKLVLFFLIGTLIGVTLSQQLTPQNYSDLLPEMLLSWPLLFFSSLMLTEPLTMPNRQNPINFYGFLVGLLFTQKFSLGPIYNSPEFTLIIANAYAFLVSDKKKYNLELISTQKIASTIYQSEFLKPKGFSFLPGQYLEWQLNHDQSDSRGIRRYFTISSSPTENTIKLTYKTFEDSSSFKKSLLALPPKSRLIATNVTGDFVLPSNASNLVFIAGGIGVTPFISQVKYLLDKKIKFDIHLLYASSKADDFVYQKLWDQAKASGLKINYFDSSKDQKITADTIKRMENYKDKTYYISGPEPMVKHYKNLLTSIAVKQIKTDYFPGF